MLRYGLLYVGVEPVEETSVACGHACIAPQTSFKSEWQGRVRLPQGEDRRSMGKSFAQSMCVGTGTYQCRTNLCMHSLVHDGELSFLS
jgi:hypothetical protein